MPLLSVVIPVYNVAEWLPECIDSVLAQDFRDYEIILVDDGSTDGLSGAICDRYYEQHPQLIRVIHQENGGLGAARNSGLTASCGEYVLFLDSDDRLAPTTLPELAEQIAATHADIYHFGITVFRNGEISETLIDPLPPNVPFTLAQQPDLLLAAPSACCRLWRRELLTDSGVRFPSRVWYEDIRTTLKFFTQAKSVVCLDKAYYYYQIRGGSIMQTGGQIGRNREIIDALDDVLAYFEQQGLSERYRDELEFLTLYHVLIVGSVRVLRQDTGHPLLGQFYDYTVSRFPDYRANPYLCRLTKMQRLLLRLLETRRFRLAAALFSIKDKISGTK